MGNNVKFISYDGAYPNLCSGILVLQIDGKNVVFPRYSMTSGGGLSANYEGTCSGEWSVDVPEEYEQYAKEITDVVNANVPHGCCGGCI